MASSWLFDPGWARAGASFQRGVSEGMYFGAQAWSPLVTGQHYQASVRDIQTAYGQHSALMAQLQSQAAQSAQAIATAPFPTVVPVTNPVFSIPNVAQQQARTAADDGGGSAPRLAILGAVAVVGFVGYRYLRKRRR
jgi:hypothetical protein